MTSDNCKKFGHRYFVADVATVTHEGRVVILALCTSCGDHIRIDEQVTEAGTQFQTRQIEKEK